MNVIYGKTKTGFWIENKNAKTKNLMNFFVSWKTLMWRISSTLVSSCQVQEKHENEQLRL
jgi:hypothetical protein